MTFRALQNMIESVDETQFYDVALFFLTALGYQNPTIVDGPYDGGRDVVCDRSDLRIQLSVQRKWEEKIEKEAATALRLGRRSLIYVCNRRLSQVARDKFWKKYRLAGQVDVTIYDSQSIASRLSMPGRLGRTFKLLGLQLEPRLSVTPKDVAVSTLLLFGSEAKSLRLEVVRANIASWLNAHGPASETLVGQQVAKLIPGSNNEELVSGVISRMRGAGEITGPAESTELAPKESERIEAAEEQLFAARQLDIRKLSKSFGLATDDAEKLLTLAINAIVRRSSSGWSQAHVDEFNGFVSEKSLRPKIDVLNKAIAQLDTITFLQRYEVIDKLFATNTFDIHSALGSSDKVKIVLDASVALPMLCSLEFSVVRSRWSAASTSLIDLAKSHGFPVIVPFPYLNEMAAHGLKAFEFQDVFNAFSPELRTVMRESRNAFISHYARIVDRDGKFDGQVISLDEFLKVFGIQPGRSVRNVQSHLEEILVRHGVTCDWGFQVDDRIERDFELAKPNGIPRLIAHDAAVCTSLIRQKSTGFILATWDKVVIDLVQEKARIYADSPGRIVDWLSYVQGIENDIGGSLEAYEALLHVEDQAVRALAEKLERVESTEHAFRLTQIIDESRPRVGKWEPSIEDLTALVEEPLNEMILHDVGDEFGLERTDVPNVNLTDIKPPL